MKVEKTLIYKFDLEKNHEILAALQYKPLYSISRSEKWGKKIQAAAYNGKHMVGNLNGRDGVSWGSVVQLHKKAMDNIF